MNIDTFRILIAHSSQLNNILAKKIDAHNIVFGKTGKIDDATLLFRHILAMDLVWLQRLNFNVESELVGEILSYQTSTHETNMPGAIRELSEIRKQADRWWSTYSNSLLESDLNNKICYRTIVGNEVTEKPLWAILAQLIIHQAHHRGEIFSILRSLGLELGSTDLFPMMENFQ